MAHRTVRASFWRAAAATVWVADQKHTLVVAVNEGTAGGEVLPDQRDDGDAGAGAGGGVPAVDRGACDSAWGSKKRV